MFSTLTFTTLISTYKNDKFLRANFSSPQKVCDPFGNSSC
eukprot:CAMPEP_0173430050 /NCGR_PEP_ID=MMETSP1357-20121228/8584_1 /TAXON_ID=77926 /ORGANISM="Hemiselmis rufescens, Strain PCC563" /LENGTH=39 /DNA_ID= /DNA_START= /DNA_END= /DNA_ORIENTATION=